MKKKLNLFNITVWDLRERWSLDLTSIKDLVVYEGLRCREYNTWKNTILNDAVPKNERHRRDIQENYMKYFDIYGVDNLRFCLDDIEAFEENYDINPKTTTPGTKDHSNKQRGATNTKKEVGDLSEREYEGNITTKESKLDNFIRQLRVGFSTDESIYLHPEGGDGKEFDCEAMGFKKNAKTWQVLITMLRDGEYHVGIHSKDGIRTPIKEYERNRKQIRDCEKKFVSFLNREYSLSLPDNTCIFENLSIKGIDRPGIYGPVFQIIKPTKQAAELVKKMSDEEIAKKLKELSKFFKRLKDQDQRLQFLKGEVAPIAEVAFKRGWFDANQYKTLFPVSEDHYSEDALDETVSEPYDDGRDLSL